LKSDYSRRKHVLLDEDTHLSLRSEDRVIGSVPLEKTYRRCCRFDLHRICIRFSPQEPRRPRFPFFQIHNVKELTSGPASGSTSVEAVLPDSWGTRGPFRFPGSTSALSRFPPSQPRRSASRFQAMAVYMAGSFCCQHPKMTKSTFFKKRRNLLGTPPALTPSIPPLRAWSHAHEMTLRTYGERPGKTRRAEAPREA